MTDATNRIVAEAMRTSRDSTLAAAIEICEEFARTGHGAECCVAALKDFQRMVGESAPRPSETN